MTAPVSLLYDDVAEQLRASVRDLLSDRAPWAAVLARSESAEPYDPRLWPALAGELGVSGLPVPEALGGHGASWRESAVVAEELGRSVAATPFLGSTLATAALVAVVGASADGSADSGAREALSRIAGGTAATLAVGAATAAGQAPAAAVTWNGAELHGAVAGLLDAGPAELLLVPAYQDDELVLVLVDATAGGLGRTRVLSLDLTRPLTDLGFEGTAGTVVAHGTAAETAVEQALLAGAVVLAAEQLGLAQRCLDLTLEYVRTRYQFGRPIGGFQAIKHRLADLWSGVSQARAVSRYAAATLADGDPDAPVAASLAQAYCSAVAVTAAEECVQLHGGIGFTWEHPAHLYLKRAKADATILGSAATHRARLAVLVDLPPA